MGGVPCRSNSITAKGRMATRPRRESQPSVGPSFAKTGRTHTPSGRYPATQTRSACIRVRAGICGFAFTHAPPLEVDDCGTRPRPRDALGDAPPMALLRRRLAAEEATRPLLI